MGFGAAPGFACIRFASFKPFWPLALLQQAPPAIIFAALRRFRGAALFPGPRPSSRLGAPFWPSGLTVRRSRPPTAAAELRALERKENFLRYLITYKIKTGEKNSLGQIELELDKEPTFMDEAILDAAMKDSIKLTESRMIALSIKSIQPIN